MVARVLDRLSDRAERLVLAGSVAAGYALYWPIGRYTASLEPHEPALAIDHATPLIPEFIYVYALVFLAGALPLTVQTGRQLFRRICASYLLAMLVSYVVFLAWPVTMTIRPEAPPVDSLATWGIALAYWLDKPSNCLPSLHVSVAMLAGLCTWSADRLVGAGGIAVAIAISASTMLVKQHWFADVVTGVLLALVAWALLVRGVEPEGTPDRRGVLWLTGAQLLMIVAFASLYASGWVPWA